MTPGNLPRAPAPLLGAASRFLLGRASGKLCRLASAHATVSVTSGSVLNHCGRVKAFRVGEPSRFGLGTVLRVFSFPAVRVYCLPAHVRSPIGPIPLGIAWHRLPVFQGMSGCFRVRVSQSTDTLSDRQSSGNAHRCDRGRRMRSERFLSIGNHWGSRLFHVTEKNVLESAPVPEMTHSELGKCAESLAGRLSV